MGMGGGGFLIICLTLFQNIPQHVAQGINLICFVPVAATALIFHSLKKLVEWKYALCFMVLGVIGAIVGAYLSVFISPFFLKKFFGGFLLLIGVNQLFKKEVS